MADIQAHGRDFAAGRGVAIGNALNVAGGLLSIVLVAGIGLWGYRMVARDVSGVPVIQAAQGAMRLTPEQPGGVPAAHQGLSVNEVAATGIAQEPPERLVLAPRPLDLAPEDLDVAYGAEPTPPVVADRGEATTADDLADRLAAGATPLGAEAGSDGRMELASVGDTASDVPSGDEALTSAALGETGLDETGLDERGLDETGLETAALGEDDALTDPDARIDGGLSQSLRPRVRPHTARTARPARRSATDAIAEALARATSTSADFGVQDVAAGDVPDGARLAQLGAFESEELARAGWDRLDARFGDYLSNKSRVVQVAQSGGRTFYRLRAMGFTDLSDARRFCAALVAENADCIPVVAK